MAVSSGKRLWRRVTKFFVLGSDLSKFNDLVVTTFECTRLYRTEILMEDHQVATFKLLLYSQKV